MASIPNYIMKGRMGFLRPSAREISLLLFRASFDTTHLRVSHYKVGAIVILGRNVLLAILESEVLIRRGICPMLVVMGFPKYRAHCNWSS